MLSNILAPLADGGKGQWPPSGVEPALTFWYEALARIRGQLMHWMDKQSKHIAVSEAQMPILFTFSSGSTIYPFASLKNVQSYWILQSLRMIT